MKIDDSFVSALANGMKDKLNWFLLFIIFFSGLQGKNCTCRFLCRKFRRSHR